MPEEDLFLALEALFAEEDAREAEQAARAAEEKAGKRKREPSEESADVCPICQDVPEPPLGVLPRCKHEFCFECIEAWSERSNVCPMCKRRFEKISKMGKGGKNLGAKKIKKRDFEDYDNDIDSDDYQSADQACMTCGSADEITRLFCCDYPNCTNVQHSYCCQPSIADPPDDGEFYCQECFETHSLPTQWTTIDPNINTALKRELERDRREQREEEERAGNPHRQGLMHVVNRVRDFVLSFF